MTRADDRGPTMLTAAPPLVAHREVLDDLLARLDATLDGASKEFAARLD